MILDPVIIDPDILLASQLVAIYNQMQASNIKTTKLILTRLAARPDGGVAALAAMGKATAAELVDRLATFSDVLNTVEDAAIDVTAIQAVNTRAQSAQVQPAILNG